MRRAQKVCSDLDLAIPKGLIEIAIEDFGHSACWVWEPHFVLGHLVVPRELGSRPLSHESHLSPEPRRALLEGSMSKPRVAAIKAQASLYRRLFWAEGFKKNHGTCGIPGRRIERQQTKVLSKLSKCTSSLVVTCRPLEYNG